jgi:hypothetical protein
MTLKKTTRSVVVLACVIPLALTNARLDAQDGQIQAPDGAKVQLTMGKHSSPPLEVKAVYVDLDALRQLSRTLNELDGLTDHAAGWKCPDLDVAQTRRVMQALAQAEGLLQRFRVETGQGRDIARRHYGDLTSTLVQRERPLARMQRLYAWQDFFTNVGKLMLDMIDITSFGNDLLAEITSGSSTLSSDGKIAAILRVTNQVNEGQQALTAAYSQAQNLATEPDGPDVPSDLSVVLQASQEYLGYVKSVHDWAQAERALETTTRTLKFARSEMVVGTTVLRQAELATLERSVKTLTESAAELKRGFKGNAATVFLSIAQSYAESLRAEMADRIKEQETILGAEQGAASGSFREWQRWAKADADVERVLEHAQRTQAALEALHAAYFAPESYQVPAEGIYTTSGQALRRLNAVLPQRASALAKAMSGFRVDRPIDPRLRLSNVSVKPGEEITVHFQAPGCFARDAWIGIVPASVSHGNGEVNDQRRIGLRKYIEKQKEGSFTFTAPAAAGSYDFRMHDTVNGGNEIATVNYTVGEARR